jgi:hypothetical protein
MKQMLITLLVGIFGYVVSILLLYILGATPEYLQVGTPWMLNHVFSSMALVVDGLILALAWPVLHNQKCTLPLLFKIWAICWLLLIADSLVFNLGTFWGNKELYQLVYTNLIVRTTLSILISPLITIYIESTKKSQGSDLVYRRWSDIASSFNDNSSKKISELENLKNELMHKNADLESRQIELATALTEIQKSPPQNKQNH